MSVAYIVATCAMMVFLLAAGAFFAMTETAYTGLSRITAKQMLKDNAPNAHKVYKIKSELDLLISTVLIGTNFVNTLNSAVATAFAMRVFGAQYVSYATAVVLVLVIVFVEIVPKTYASFNQRQAAQRTATLILLIQKVFYPVVWLFFQFTRFIDIIEKRLIKASRPVITEEELKALIAIGGNEGTLQQDERRMLERIFEFSDLNVKGIMRHRSLVRFVSTKDTFEDVMKAFGESGFSRLPVYEGSNENVVGVLHFKSLLFASSSISQSSAFIRSCMSRPLFVPETLSAVGLLKRFKEQKEKFAVALNEYGEMTGIVTLDSLLQAVFGRIASEHGTIDTAPEQRIAVIGTNEFIVPGDMKLEDVNNVLYLDLTSENFYTLGGWLLEHFDELPPAGAAFKNAGTTFIVEDQSERRIQSVRIKL